MSLRILPVQLDYVEEAHDVLGLTYNQIAAALGADESTLHRWRAGETEPRSVFLTRMEALHEVQTELLDALNPDNARKWLRQSVAVLSGRTPLSLLEEGKIEPVTRLLIQLNLGTSI